MYALLLAAGLAPTPALPAATDMTALFRAQQAAAIHAIRVGIQADLEHRGAHYFAEQGELDALLKEAIVVDAELAAR